MAVTKAAAGAGARIFEGSAVRRTRFTRKSADVLTANGLIRARGIYVATGRPGPVFRQLERHVHVRHGFAVVTEPLSAAMKREVGPREAVVRDARPDGTWTRWLPDGRALFAGGVSAEVPDRQMNKVLVQRTGQLMYELSVQFPAISGLPARWGWPVPLVSTSDGLPWIGRTAITPFISSRWRSAGTPTAWLGLPPKPLLGISRTPPRARTGHSASSGDAGLM